MVIATGIGSWPDTDLREAVVTVRDQLATGLPYLPELPARGPGADMIGRAAGLLEGLSVDLQPSGWRITERPGRDAARTAAYWRQDLDELAEAYDGYTGALKLSVTGPWTLAANVRTSRGELLIGDPGARRDVAQSLTDGIGGLITRVRGLIPGAQLTVQIDEPSLPGVLQGALKTSSGFGRIPAIDRVEAVDVLRAVVEHVRAQDARCALHCCATDNPLPVLRESRPDALAVDTTVLGPRGWEGLAVAAEQDIELWFGAVPTLAEPERASTIAAHIAEQWTRVGMPLASLADAVVSPTCGLAGLSPAQARARHTSAVDAAKALTDEVHG